MIAIRNGFLVLVVMLSSRVLFADGQLWTMDAIMALKTISDPQISSDGSKVAYVVRSANFQRKAYDSQIWIVSTSGGVPQPLKSSHVSDGRPRWSRKGSQLAFVSRRDGRPQIYAVATPDGQPRKLTASASGVGDFKWSPDDTHIGYLAVDAPSAEEKQRIQVGDDPIVANQGYRYSRLYEISTNGGAEKRLTASDRHVTSFDWAPDGKKVVYSGQITPRNRDSFHVDLYELDLSTRRETVLVAQEGRDAEPSYSPDGRWIAFHSQAGTINYFEERHVGLVPSGGGEIRYLTRNLSADVFRGGNEFFWTKDGSELIFGAGAGTQDHLFTVRLKDGTSAKLIESLAGPSSFSVSANGQQLAFLKSSPSVPPRLYAATKAGDKWQARALVSVNPEEESLPKVTAKTQHWK
jgi:Tol biopolymer transport system component